MGALRIFHTADWHLGKTWEGIDRTRDFEVFLDDFFALVSERRPDVLLMSGDIFDKPDPTPAARELWQTFLRRLKDTSLRLTVVTAGNHDGRAPLAEPEALLREARVIVAGETAHEQAVFLRDADGTPLLGIAAVPFLTEADVPGTDPTRSTEERCALFQEGVRLHYEAVYRELRKEADQSVPLIAMGHLFVPGSKPRPDGEPTSDRNPLRNAPVTAFGDKWCYIALGHIHNGQTVPGPIPTVYSGSPLSLTYNHDRYVHRIAEITLDGETLKQTDIPVPQRRRFVTLTGTADALRGELAECASRSAEGVPPPALTPALRPFVRIRLTEPVTKDRALALRALGESLGLLMTDVTDLTAAER